MSDDRVHDRDNGSSLEWALESSLSGDASPGRSMSKHGVHMHVGISHVAQKQRLARFDREARSVKAALGVPNWLTVALRKFLRIFRNRASLS